MCVNSSNRIFRPIFLSDIRIPFKVAWTSTSAKLIRKREVKYWSIFAKQFLHFYQLLDNINL